MARRSRKRSTSKGKKHILRWLLCIALVVGVVYIAYEPVKNAWQRWDLKRDVSTTLSSWADKIGGEDEAVQDSIVPMTEIQPAQPMAQAEKPQPKKQTSAKPQPRKSTTPASTKTTSAQKPKVSAAPVRLQGAFEIPGRMRATSERILKRMGYTVSFNSTHNIPNWVAWQLDKSRLAENESRTDDFLPDPDLPQSKAVTTNDYKRSGWDRGHMCPAADNRWHWKAMQESFYMTNICPQNHNLNRGDWKELEEACRDWVQSEGKLYIVCGPILYKQQHQTIGKQHKVTVPEAFFKVVLSTSGKQPKAIGFIYQNASGNRKMSYYATTVDQVEHVTGIDFFPALPDAIEKQVEASYNFDLWKRN